jgi:hypothetical protein
MIKLFGRDIESAVGKQIILFITKVYCKGDEVDGIRIRGFPRGGFR